MLLKNRPLRLHKFIDVRTAVLQPLNTVCTSEFIAAGLEPDAEVEP